MSDKALQKVQRPLWSLVFQFGVFLLATASTALAKGEKLPDRVTWETLPKKLEFDAMTSAEVARQLFDIKLQPTRNCISSIFLQDNGTPKPFLIRSGYRRAGGSGAILKLNGRLRPAFANSTGLNKLPLGISIQTSNFAPIDSILQFPYSGYGVALIITAADIRIVKRRTQCTIGEGVCRRYDGVFKMHWYDFASRTTPPVDVSSMRLLIEDSCPNTRGALVEHFVSRVQLFEYWHELINE